jgi:hypothetical protein
MSRSDKWRTFSADFETTVEENTKQQTSTEVWSAASVELWTEDVMVFHSIGELFDYYVSLNENIVVYFHNLKFDGNFWLYYLMYDLDYKQAFDYNEDGETGHFRKNWEMQDKSYKYVISDMGQWYSFTIKVNGHYIELKDSLKLLPFSLKQIGLSFKTKHQKLEMEYKGKRYAGCHISQEELKYIANDVLVIKEALEFMFNEGHRKLTIGSCCLDEFRKGKTVGDDYNTLFPDLYQIPLDAEVFGSATAGDWIHKSYKGGWCYLVKGKECKEYNHGVTADVNSLYPSVMHSDSGSDYPIGKPKFVHLEAPVGGMYDAFACPAKYDPFWFQPEPKPKKLWEYGTFYFFRIKTRFYLKPGKLPFVQIKGSWLYKGTEALESSDVIGKDGVPHSEYYDIDGNLHDTRVELTLTQTDFILLREHYNLVDYEMLDYCSFDSTIGLFDEYINKYAAIKKTSKGAMRQLAKLFLNNLYGKMASSMNSSFKVAFKKDDGSVGFYEVEENEKKPGYIPVGSAITSYARNFTIRAAQQNYYGKDKPGFIYADTDSIHCDLSPSQLKGITVHPSNFCCWKLESSWDKGWFVRQKTYIEHVVAEDLEPIDNPYFNIKCAGMPKKCKDLFAESFNDKVAEDIENGIDPRNEEQKLCDSNLTPEEIHFLSKTRTFKDFKTGLTVPGKLLPRRIKGGVLLVDTDFTMR